MLIDLETAQKVDPEMTQRDILALEKTITKETNNNFRLYDYPMTITAIDRDGTVHVQGDNFIQALDTVEVRDVPYLDDIYHVKEVGADYIKLDLEEPLRFASDDLSGRLYIVQFPRDVRQGATGVLEYLAKQQKQAPETGVVRAKSVGRVRYEYATRDDSSNLIYGAPQHLWTFLEPYRRLRWL